MRTVDCPICGGLSERLGLIDISHLTGYKVHKVSYYICSDCGKRHLLNGQEVQECE